jgi:predicted Zn-dependent protease
MDKYAESADAVKRALELKPDAPYLHAWLSQAYTELGRPEQAEAELKVLETLDRQLAADVRKIISEKKSIAGLH